MKLKEKTYEIPCVDVISLTGEDIIATSLSIDMPDINVDEIL